MLNLFIIRVINSALTNMKKKKIKYRLEIGLLKPVKEFTKIFAICAFNLFTRNLRGPKQKGEGKFVKVHILVVMLTIVYRGKKI